MNQIYDISWPLTKDMTTYKNREDFDLAPTKIFGTHSVRESRLMLGSHVGTHIDAPAHFLENGDSNDMLDLKRVCGPCTVLDLTHIKESIKREDLEKYALTSPRVLLKTSNSVLSAEGPFNADFVYVHESAAEYLVEKGCHAVGIDYIGIERNQIGHPTHKILLAAQCSIIEGLRLGAIVPGDYTLICLPLALIGADAAPARAILSR